MLKPDVFVGLEKYDSWIITKNNAVDIYYVLTLVRLRSNGCHKQETVITADTLEGLELKFNKFDKIS